MTSVIYSLTEAQTKTHINDKHHHNTVFFNTTAWGSHPHASPEGHGTTPSEKCQRWSTAGPLGAAMRPTALRQTPKDSPRPMNLRLKKRKPTTIDSPSPHICHRKTLSADTEKSRRTGQYGTPKSGAIQAPHSANMYYPLSEPTTRTTGTCESHLPTNFAPNKPFPQTFMLTYTRHLTGNLGAERPSSEMRPQIEGEQTAVPGPLAGRRHTPSLPLLYTAKHREHTEANYQSERNDWNGGRVPESVRPSPLHMRQRPLPLRRNF
jgi:hypothetical protein